MHLPCDRSAADNLMANSESGPQSALAKRRVLVVDDTRAAAYMLGRLLESLGQEVSVCYDAETAMRIALDNAPQIIFSDIMMPHVDGYQFAQQIRADNSFRDVVLIALTGYDGESERQLAYKAGFDHHIVKPVSVQALKDLLK